MKDWSLDLYVVYGKTVADGQVVKKILPVVIVIFGFVLYKIQFFVNKTAEAYD